MEKESQMKDSDYIPGDIPYGPGIWGRVTGLCLDGLQQNPFASKWTTPLSFLWTGSPVPHLSSSFKSLGSQPHDL